MGWRSACGGAHDGAGHSAVGRSGERGDGRRHLIRPRRPEGSSPARRSGAVAGALRLAALGLVGALAACETVSPPPSPEVRISTPPTAATILDVATGQPLWSQTFARRLAAEDVDLVILGEVHDNEEHHALQAWTVEMLDQLRPSALGRRPLDLPWLRDRRAFGGVGGLAFEQFSEAQEEAVNAALRFAVDRPKTVMEELPGLLDWENSGWPDFAFYAPIINAAPSATLIGGGIPRGALMPMARAGAAARPDAARFGLDRPLDPAERTIRIAGQVAAHCDAIPPEAAGPMVEAQRIRDAALAAALLRASEAGSGFAVLITGNGHARRDWGAPRMLARAAPEKRVISVGLLEVGPGEPTDLASLGAAWGRDRPPFDYVFLTGRQARPDPCEAFRAAREGG